MTTLRPFALSLTLLAVSSTAFADRAIYSRSLERKLANFSAYKGSPEQVRAAANRVARAIYRKGGLLFHNVKKIDLRMEQMFSMGTLSAEKSEALRVAIQRKHALRTAIDPTKSAIRTWIATAAGAASLGAYVFNYAPNPSVAGGAFVGAVIGGFAGIYAGIARESQLKSRLKEYEALNQKYHIIPGDTSH